MKKIGFFNSKGGCGKTTSLFHIAGVLADNGMKVLAVDLDKQGDTTNALLGEDESEYSDNGKNVLDFFRGDAAFEDVVKKPAQPIEFNTTPQKQKIKDCLKKLS